MEPIDDYNYYKSARNIWRQNQAEYQNNNELKSIEWAKRKAKEWSDEQMEKLQKIYLSNDGEKTDLEKQYEEELSLARLNQEKNSKIGVVTGEMSKPNCVTSDEMKEIFNNIKKTNSKTEEEIKKLENLQNLQRLINDFAEFGDFLSGFHRTKGLWSIINENSGYLSKGFNLNDTYSTKDLVTKWFHLKFNNKQNTINNILKQNHLCKSCGKIVDKVDSSGMCDYCALPF